MSNKSTQLISDYLDFKGDYLKSGLWPDLAAALVILALAIPQSMAYAMIAGVPIKYGLYTAIVSCIVASLFGSSQHLTSGTTNATSLMFAATIAVYSGPLGLIELIFIFTFMIGAIKFLCGLLRLGSLVHYISDSVILGFTAGAGILIAGGQLKHLLGVELASPGGAGFFPKLAETIKLVPEANPAAVAVAVISILMILIVQKINSRLPAELMAVIMAGLAVYFLSLPIKTVGDLGSIPRSIPGFTWYPFDWEAGRVLFSGAVAVATIGLMESTASSKAIAADSGQRIDSNREFRAQGLSNMVGAFFANYASSGSFTRSALAYQCGGRTRLAPIMSGLLVMVLILAFGPLGEYIPIASLAGIIMLVAYRMVNKERLKMVLKTGFDNALILVLTLAGTILLRIDYAIYLGMTVSIIIYIKNTSVPHFALLMPTNERHRFTELPLDQINHAELAGKLAIFNLDNALYFGIMDDFVRELRPLMEQKPKAVVLRMRRVYGLDSSAVTGLAKLQQELKKKKIPFYICGVHPRVHKVLQRTGLEDKIGSSNIISSQDIMFQSLESIIELVEKESQNWHGDHI